MKALLLRGVQSRLSRALPKPIIHTHKRSVLTNYLAQARLPLIEKFEKRYAEMPFELKTMICAAFATRLGERRLYIDAFFLHKGYDAMRLPLLEAIATTEVMLRGTEHEAQFAAFHPLVVERAKFLKLVYE